MKLLKLMPIMAMLVLGTMTSCNKEIEMDGTTTGLNSDLKSGNIKDPNSNKPEKGDKPQKGDKPENGKLEGVNLGVAGDFVILSKSGITDVYPSVVTGDVGTSPITGAALLLKCDEVTGTIFTDDAAGPLPCSVTNASRLTTAVGDMQTAYTDAAGRSEVDFLNLGAGDIGGETLTAGLYKFTSAVIIPTDITISGGSSDVWIFQIAGTLDMSSSVRITLKGGAQAKNIFWQTSGAVTLGTSSHFEGNILSQTAINLQTGASINGRMLAQTEVTLQMNTVNQP